MDGIGKSFPQQVFVNEQPKPKAVQHEQNHVQQSQTSNPENQSTAPTENAQQAQSAPQDTHEQNHQVQNSNFEPDQGVSFGSQSENTRSSESAQKSNTPPPVRSLSQSPTAKAAEGLQDAARSAHENWKKVMENRAQNKLNELGDQTLFQQMRQAIENQK